MTGLPRKYALMGFKKGWVAYKARHRKVQKKSYSKRKKTRIQTMVRHRRARKSYRKSFSKGVSFGSATKVLIGAAGAALWEVVVSPMIPLGDTVKNIIELFIGLFLAAMPNVPMVVRAGGAALATINAYALIMPYLSGLGSNNTQYNFD